MCALHFGAILSGERLSQGKWLLTNLASEGPSMYHCNWGWKDLSHPFQMDSDQVTMNVLLLQSLTENKDWESERNWIPIHYHLCKCEQWLHLLGHQFSFLSHVDGHAYFRRRLFVRQCMPPDSHLALSPLAAVCHCHMETIHRPLFSNPALDRGWSVLTIQACLLPICIDSVLHPELSVRTSLWHIFFKVLFPLCS